MTKSQEIKTAVLPYVKGVPFVVFCVVLALVLCSLYVKYAEPTYQSVAKIKLDDQTHGFSHNNLYADFDIFSTKNKIEAEVEVLKSPLLVGQVINQLNHHIQLYRIGKVKQTRLTSTNSPISVTVLNGKITESKTIQFSINANGEIQFNGQSHQLLDTINYAPYRIQISPNEKLENKVELEGNYKLVLQPEHQLIQSATERLSVISIDKEVAVLRIVYKDEQPEIAQQFANLLCEVYVEDYVSTKTAAANSTLQFIDQQLIQVNNELKNSEAVLEDYKKQNGVVNTLQETETGLREISRIKVQLINTQMQKKALDSLNLYIQTGDFFDEKAINFGFGDLVLTELIKRMKLLKDERRDLLLKYTPQDPSVISVEAKIGEVKRYIVESINTAKHDLDLRITELETSLALESTMFDGLPTREREMKVLERQFQLNEEVYRFLSQKRTEAAIAGAALISFHRIIQPALLQSKPIAPNGTLLRFLSGLFGLIIGIGGIFLKETLSGKVRFRSDIEKRSNIPVFGVVTKRKRQSNNLDKYRELAQNINGTYSLNEPFVIAITSSIQHEDSWQLAEGMASNLAKFGYKVVCLNLSNNGNNSNNYGSNEELTEYVNSCFKQEALLSVFNEPDEDGVGILSSRYFNGLVNNLEQQSEVLIIQTPPSIASASCLPALKMADLNLYVVKAGYSNRSYLLNADLLKEKHQLKNLQFLLTETHKATSYTGAFVSSKAVQSDNPRNLLSRMYHYYVKS